ncbi:MAG: DUF1580 domain-containing protein [Phycisphaeraceae bacterium]
MMIDIHEDQLIPIREVPKRLPARPSGRQMHISAIYRWIQRGVRGVKLEAVKIGGSSYTSLEALQRFSEQLTLQNKERRDPPLSAQRRRQIEAASRQVAEILGIDRKVKDPRA